MAFRQALETRAQGLAPWSPATAPTPASSVLSQDPNVGQAGTPASPSARVTSLPPWPTLPVYLLPVSRLTLVLSSPGIPLPQAGYRPLQAMLTPFLALCLEFDFPP